MHLRCPHCQNPIELADVPSAGEITCVGCGSSFQLDKFATVTWDGPANQRIGKFEVLGTLGHGAFGTVLKARDTELDRIVAIKIPRAGNVGRGQEDIDRFLREARSVAQLRFPSIITLHEVGIDNSAPYLVCDFVAGVTLADLLSGRRLTFQESAKLLAEVADALQYAHSLGVVHRDVKPSNIMIRPDGSPCVMDFGLAKRDAGEITMTIDGQILGTPAYMSPEQARGEGHRVDGRSDVYSLGVILYQLLTGELPFRGNKAMLLHQVLHDEPHGPRTLNDKIPHDLETIALKAMAKEPARRYASAKELADDLRHWLAGEPILARPIGRLERLARWARRRPAVAGLLLLTLLLTVGGLGGILWAYGQALAERDSALKAEKRAEEQRDKADASRKEKLRELYFSRVNLAHAEWQSGNVDRAESLLDSCPKELVGMEWHYLKRLCHPEQRSLRLPEPWGIEIAYNQKGTRLAIATDNTVVIWDLAKDKAIRKIISNSDLLNSSVALLHSSVALSPDGKIVAAGFGDGNSPNQPGEVSVWNVDTGELMHHFKKNFDSGVWSVTFGEDAKHGLRLAAVSGNPISNLGKFVIWSMPMGKELLDRPIPFGAGWPQGKAVFSPNGEWLAMAVNRLVVVNAETGDPLLNSLKKIISVATDKEGTHLVALVPGGPDRFLLWNTSDWTKLPYQIPAVTHARRFALSPDGKTVAWSDLENLVHLYDVGGPKPPRVLRGHGNFVTGIAFRFDGKELATISADGTARFWDPRQPQQRFRTLPGGAASFGSSDDELLRARGKKFEFLEAAGDGIKKTIPFDQGIAALERSPDGKWLAVGGMEGAVAIYDLAQQRWKLPHLTGHGGRVSRLCFDRSGQHLVSADEKGDFILWDTDAGKPKKVWKGEPGLHQSLALHPDGQKLVFAAAKTRHTVTLAFWDVHGDKEFGSRRTIYRPGVCAFSPDGQHLALSDRVDIGIWNLQTGPPWEETSRPSKILPGHFNRILDLRYSPDGRRLASFGWDLSLRLWDTDTGEPTLRIMSFVGSQNDNVQRSRICFSPGGHHLAVKVNQVHVLDARP